MFIEYCTTSEAFEAMGYSQDQYSDFKQYMYENLKLNYPLHEVTIEEKHTLYSVYTNDFSEEYTIMDMTDYLFYKWCSLQ